MLFTFSLSAFTQLVNLGLNARVGELLARDTKIAVYTESLEKSFWAWGKPHPRPQLDWPPQGGLRHARKQPQQILDSSALGCHLERRCFAVLARLAGDHTLGQQRGLLEIRLHLLQLGVAICTIHDGFEFGRYMNCRGASANAEVGHIHVSSRMDFPDHAAHLPVSEQRAVKALEKAQIYILVAIGT